MDNITVVDLGTGGELNSQDINILEGSFSTSLFNPTRDKVELTVTDLNNELQISDPEFFLYSVENDPSLQNTNEISTLSVDVQRTLDYYGFDRGILNLKFDFYTPLFFTSENNKFYISEISTDRTEARLDSLTLDDPAVLKSVQDFINQVNSSANIIYFYLNFGGNQLVPAVNLVLDNGSIVVKFYNTLPSQYQVKNTFFLTQKVAEPMNYQVTIPDPVVDEQETVFTLKGPNLNLDIKNQVGVTSNYSNAGSLLSTTLTSSFAQLSSLLADKGVEINVDYTDYGNFVYYSSATQRVLNFYQKVSLLENYQNELGRTVLNVTGSTSSSLFVSQSRVILQNKIDEIKTNFDGYDYYLYYESGSKAWPKTNATQPYTLASTGSAAVTSWIGSSNPASPNYGGQLYSASLYDELNKDNLLYTIPEYLREDSSNLPYELFVSMIGQHFDNLWLYSRGVTDRLDSDNRPDFGAPKALMGDILRSFGLKVYTNQFSGDDLYASLTGFSISGSGIPSTGSEVINSYITASSFIPANDITVEVYKRLYHNLPYLLKKKGTVEGIRALANIYGIPDTILRINEFGGKDEIEGTDFDTYQQVYNLAYYTGDGGSIESSFQTPGWNDNSVPNTVAVRFKLPSTSSLLSQPSQSLWDVEAGGQPTLGLVLEYTGTGNTSGTYSGSIAATGSQFTTLKFYADSTTSASVNLPINNEGWWTAVVSKVGTTWYLYAGSNVYNGYTGAESGFYASSSVAGNDTVYIGGEFIYFPTNTRVQASLGGKTYDPFTGYYQEVKYYGVGISESIARSLISNPSSIEGNNISSSYTELAARLPLGNELYTGSVSVHPAVSGSGVKQDSFASDSNFTINSGEWVNNEETFFLEEPIAGIKNRVPDKIRLVDPTLVEGNTLSSYVSIQKDNAQTNTYTRDINYVEVSFSPTNEINDDIVAQLGFFNIGEFIGDPRHQSASSYNDLTPLREEYFKKYVDNYDYNDYIRILKYFDNTLFKMIQDFAPARSSVAAGVVIKQHLLERSKYPVPQVGSTELVYSGSIDVETTNGGAGGSVNAINGLTNDFNVTQSWVESIITPVGLVEQTRSSQQEFYNGEYSGSSTVATTGDLSAGNPFRQVDQPSIQYNTVLYDANTDSFQTFLATNPGSGGCLIFYDRGTLAEPKQPPLPA